MRSPRPWLNLAKLSEIFKIEKDTFLAINCAITITSNTEIDDIARIIFS